MDSRRAGGPKHFLFLYLHFEWRKRGCGGPVKIWRKAWSLRTRLVLTYSLPYSLLCRYNYKLPRECGPGGSTWKMVISFCIQSGDLLNSFVYVAQNNQQRNIQGDKRGWIDVLSQLNRYLRGHPSSLLSQNHARVALAESEQVSNQSKLRKWGLGTAIYKNITHHVNNLERCRYRTILRTMHLFSIASAK